MSRFDDAKALIAHAEKELKNIEEGYSKSLSEKTLKEALLISIKNFMENLRSALDYSAHALFDKFSSTSSAKRKIYFPYALETQSLEDFKKAQLNESKFPGINAHPHVVAELVAVQHFSNAQYSWIPKFMELCNENKHQQLTPQERKEAKQLTISSGTASISLGEGASISLGGNASIQIGRMTIKGNQTIDANNPPQVTGNGSVNVTTWVSFAFSLNKEPVLPLLKSALRGTREIVERLSQL